MNRGEVSTITGRRQVPALRLATMTALVLSGLGSLGAGGMPAVAGTIAITLVVATPLLRVGWLIHRLAQERDTVFVWVAVALLAVVALGGALAFIT